jgi:hypothetical protein
MVELVIIYIWVSPCKGHTILGGLGPFLDTIHSNKPKFSEMEEENSNSEHHAKKKP